MEFCANWFTPSPSCSDAVSVDLGRGEQSASGCQGCLFKLLSVGQIAQCGFFLWNLAADVIGGVGSVIIVLANTGWRTALRKHSGLLAVVWYSRPARCDL